MPEPTTPPRTIRVQVTVDTDELRRWADWHADRDHHGVAHVLYKAATDGETLTEQSRREDRERIAEAVLREPLPPAVIGRPNVKAWFVEGVRWAAGVARESA